MQNDKVSVISPVYNVEKHLEKCLDSVLGQTHRNLEVLLVDDGSRDRSGEICDAYASRDDRIVCVHQENGGVSKARIAGLPWRPETIIISWTATTSWSPTPTSIC